MSTNPVLGYPSLAEGLILFTDASGFGIGTVLEQGNNVISHANRMLMKAERNYNTLEKEYLVFGTKQFRHYLLGVLFE